MATIDIINANLATLGFTNTSATAIGEKIAEALAITVDNTITEINNTQQVILNLISSKNYGSADYYVAAAKYYQEGDNLVVNPVTLAPVYAVIDATKNIISQAAFVNNGGTLGLKVATTGISGSLAPLTIAQLAAFQSYFTTFEIPGLPVTIISVNGNVLSFNASCTYYSTYNFTTLQTAIQAALITFQNTFQFNGIFYPGDLEAYIRANVPGVRDFYISNTTIDGTPFIGSTALQSGYFNYISNIINNITYAAI